MDESIDQLDRDIHLFTGSYVHDAAAGVSLLSANSYLYIHFVVWRKLPIDVVDKEILSLPSFFLSWAGRWINSLLVIDLLRKLLGVHLGIWCTCGMCMLSLIRSIGCKVCTVKSMNFL